MNNITRGIVTAALISISFIATAGPSASSIFASKDGQIWLAQAKAVNDYAQHLHEMMIRDKRMMPMLDSNHDGEISEQEFRQAFERAFNSFDTDGDGMIDRQEINNAADERSAPEGNRMNNG